MKNKTVSLDAKPAPAVEAEAAKADKPTKKAEAKDPVLAKAKTVDPVAETVIDPAELYE